MPETNLTPDEPFEQTAVAPLRSGRVTVYDTRTGEPSQVLEYLVAGQLRKRREDGSRAFTLDPPATPPVRGTLKCRLHPDDPEREHWDSMGFPRCPRVALPNRYQQIQHMRKAHKVEWAAIQEEAQELERAERRRYEQTIATAVLERVRPGQYTELCPVCGDQFEAGAAVAAVNKLRAHQRAAHPEVAVATANS
jgi:hypothetical protein